MSQDSEPHAPVASTVSEDLINEDVNRFYRSLVLWRIIGPSNSDHTHQDTLQAIKRSCKKWEFALKYRYFLDGLCWFADWDCGGNTVTSMAAQDAAGGPRYWVACNNRAKIKVRRHLETTLKSLRRVTLCETAELPDFEDELVRTAINFSIKKALNYRRRLSGTLLGQAEPGDAFLNEQHPLRSLPGTNGQSVLEFIPNVFRTPEADIHDLCEAAYQFRKDNVMKQLKQEAKNSPYLSSIRHYIGRLSSWRKAARAMIDLAIHAPSAVQESEIVEPISWALYPRPATDDISLEPVIKDLIPDVELLQTPVGLQLRKQLERDDIAKRYSTDIRKAKPEGQFHAEVIIAEHFYREGMSFWKNYKYIGCSKPLCYTCDLYMEFHPGGYECRLSHGNVYTKWLPPSLVIEKQDALDLHNHEILNQMTQAIQSDILDQGREELQLRRKTFDSATGITSTIAASL